MLSLSDDIFGYRLCTRDAHQLFQRLESHAIDYILEVKVRLLHQLTSGHNTPEQAKAFVSLMLEEYSSLCVSAKILSDIFNRLVCAYVVSVSVSQCQHPPIYHFPSDHWKGNV